jgi:hypothetical protein
MHFDGAILHRPGTVDNCFQSCQFRYAAQPPYTAEISPSGFFLFGDLKPKLKDAKFETMKDLANWLIGIPELFGMSQDGKGQRTKIGLRDSPYST